MFQWLADLISRILLHFKSTNKPISNSTLPVSVRIPDNSTQPVPSVVKPENPKTDNDSNQPVVQPENSQSDPKTDNNTDKPVPSIIQPEKPEPILIPKTDDNGNQISESQPKTDVVSGLTLDTKQENSWNEGATLWTQYQFYLTNHNGKTIRDVNIIVSSGFKQMWNLVKHDDYMSLPDWIIKTGLQAGSTVNFGGIFSETPEIKITRAIF